MWNQKSLEPDETIYDLLRGIVNRTPWKDEVEQKKYTALVGKLEEVNLFGYMATKTTVNTGDIK